MAELRTEAKLTILRFLVTILIILMLLIVVIIVITLIVIIIIMILTFLVEGLSFANLRLGVWLG